ncbi:outer membrane protein assembly factor BamD [Ectothiorhodospira mobilis]|uniref:outer membrane protein assembly factor BamD n=1 Tax=Ectothiorhodospira mobilis TaxID=195064 RepID=UPI001F5BEE89|nr:outer membrane protein assembly factor BamD [Ectothiorhodospira mobilis]
MSAVARLILTALLPLLAVGCAAMGQDPKEDWSAQRFYEEAQAALERGNYEQAVSHYETLEARYPFGPYAQQAQLEIAYAYHKAQEPEMALAAIDRFLRMNPRHPHVDYAYYLRGRVNAGPEPGILDRLFNRDPARRDANPLQQAFEDFGTVVRRYPDSRYARDARERMVHLRNQLAAHEMHVAGHYMRRGAWLAAARRGAYVVEHYAGAQAVPDALTVMVRAYRHLGLEDLSQDALRVLEENFPERAAGLRQAAAGSTPQDEG